MAAEDIGQLVPTKIPGLSDQADIQAALRLYHYGSYTFDTAETDPAELVNPSIAYTLNDLQDQIDAVSGGTSIAVSSFNAKGDLLSASANDTLSVLSVGSNGRVLTANSSTTTGLEWATPAVTLTNSVTLSGKGIALGSNTVTGTISEFNTALTDADFATLAGSEVLTNKELKSPTETMNIVASAATGTINFNTETSTVWYYTSNASANHTLNFRHSTSATLDSVLSVGESITVIWMNTNGTTAYYPNVIQIDGTTVTPKWSGGTAPSSGNASSIDVYAFNIIKTASATFVVLGSQSKFA
jgi:uncharacterized protein YaiE (UPF0345 family)